MAENGHHTGTNYTEQGAKTTNIGGTLNIQTGGIIAANGTQAAHIIDATDLATALTRISAMLVALENVGIVASA
jgi:hypothetical protein